MDLLDQLDAKQRLAAQHGAGPCIVMAAAGSGKTRVLTHRIAHLIEQYGVEPQNICAMTFTKKAANEMQERLEALLGGLGPTLDVTVGTIHSVCYRMLREDWASRNEVYEILAGYMQKRLFRDLLAAPTGKNPHGLNWDIDIKLAMGQIGYWQNDLVRPEDVDITIPDGPRWQQLYLAYEQAKRSGGYLDLDDMITWTYVLLRENPAVRARWQKQWPYVMVDECVPYRTPIVLENGRVMPIGEIVEKKIRTKVLSYNTETHQQEYKDITGYHRVQRGKPLYRAKVVRAGTQSLSHRKQIYGINYLVATGDHRVFTYEHGWTPLRNLQPGETVQLESTTAQTPKMVEIAQFNEHYKHSLKGKGKLATSISQRNFNRDRVVSHGRQWMSPRGGNGRGRSPAESVLSEALGPEWQDQYVIATKGIKEGYPHHYKIDIANPTLRIAIEVDGQSHNSLARKVQDFKKDEWLSRNGWTVYRVTNSAVLNDVDKVVKDISSLTLSKEVIHSDVDCPVYGEILLVERIDIKDSAVYDITVEDNHNYYANGVLVHNCQDNSRAQWEILRLLAAPHNNLFVVGDADQSIFSFRGARPEFFSDFGGHYPHTARIDMETNYRSLPYIVQAGNRLINWNPRQQTRETEPHRPGDQIAPVVWQPEDDDDEGVHIADYFQVLHESGDVAWADMACIYRTNAQSQPIEDALVREKIPYRILGGVGFWGRKEVRDIVSYLRLLADPHDMEAYQRAIMAPSRYLGKVFIHDAVEYARHTGMNLIEATRAVPCKPYQQRNARAFVQVLGAIQDLEHPADQIEAIRDLTDYDTWFTRNELGDDDDEDRMANLTQLQRVARQFGTTADLLRHIAMIEDQTKTDDDRTDKVTLLTIHRAKGLEWPVVILPGLIQGVLPHKHALAQDPEGDAPRNPALEEERRLAYVAITRARDVLVLSVPQHHRGRLTEPSQFIEEIGVPMDYDPEEEARTHASETI